MYSNKKRENDVYLAVDVARLTPAAATVGSMSPCLHGHSHGFLIWPPTFANQSPCWVESQFFVYHFISRKLESFSSIDS